MKKRMISMLLAAVLCTGIMPAYAAEQPDEPSEQQFRTEIFVNPLYADVVTEQDIRDNTDNGIACYADEPEEVFDSLEEAGTYLREKMEVHTPEISFTINLGDTPKDIDYRDIYDETIKETGVPTQGDYIRWGCSGYSVSFLVGYNYSTNTWYEKYNFAPAYFASAEQEEELTQKFNEVMSTFDLDGKTVYQKIKMLYTYVCDNVTYDYKNLNDTAYTLKYSAYAALINKTAVCQGYAALMYRMLWQAGIPNRIIASDNHGWNIVKIGDVYYNIDSTWDAGHSSRPNYFLCTNEDDWFHVKDHERQSFYKTEEFNAAYPMATENYQPTEEDLHTHTWNAGSITKPATCTEDGIKTYTCSGCSKTKTETIKATGHKEVIDVKAIAPTCSTPGRSEGSHCSVCDEILKIPEILPATGEHTWDNGKVTTKPTCVKNGVKTYTCTTCETTKTEEIPATGKHTWDSGKITTQPTCTANGVKTLACTTCNTTKTEDISKIQHSFTNYQYNNDAKVGIDGTETAYCDYGCGNTDTRIKSGTALAEPTPEPTPTINFIDIESNAYYADAVQWAVAKGITNGTSETTFSPDNTCTRAQVVTFLWRAKGKPEPSSTYNPFVDVPSNAYYYKAVLWAVEQGITNGTSGNTFSPDAGCTRGQVATFLWRAEGKPYSDAYNPFIDVPSNAYYYQAVLWAVDKGITNGTSYNTFSPDDTCTRGQIVTFLYRDMA